MNKYQKAWEKFENKMNELRKRQKEILLRIYDKLDQQKIEIIRKKLKNR
jgi:hypothetical protein